jgi:hypothetical protein
VSPRFAAALTTPSGDARLSKLAEVWQWRSTNALTPSPHRSIVGWLLCPSFAIPVLRD